MPSLTEDFIKACVSSKDVYIFVETGTNEGDTLNNAYNTRCFSRMCSVELHDGLYNRCRSRFRDVHGVELFHGDSKKLLPEMVKLIDSPQRALFFLDAHYDGVGSVSAISDEWIPLKTELDHISKSQRNDHVIIIDDLSAMDNTHYDKTTKKWAGGNGIDKVIEAVMEINTDYRFYLMSKADRLVCTTSKLPQLKNVIIPTCGPWGDYDPKARGLHFCTDKQVLNIMHTIRMKNFFNQVESLMFKLNEENMSKAEEISYGASIDTIGNVKRQISLLLEEQNQ